MPMPMPTSGRARGSVRLRCDAALRVRLADGAALEGVVLSLDPETALVYLLEPPAAVTVFAHADCVAAEELPAGDVVSAWWRQVSREAAQRRQAKAEILARTGGLDEAQQKALLTMPLREAAGSSLELFAEGVARVEAPPGGPLTCSAPRRGLDARLENLLLNANEEPPRGPKSRKSNNRAKPQSRASAAAATTAADASRLGELCVDGRVQVGPQCTLYRTSVALPRYSAYAPPVTNMNPGGEFDPASGIPRKYYAQRYRLFSRFDEGILMDQESWYSVTPETIAEHIAERCRSEVIVDAFAGAGGNAIQFAFTCEQVIAIEIDRNRLEMARHNARIYGVEDRIEFIHGDALDVLAMLAETKAPVDAVFISPPWGGPTYQNVDDFLLEHIRVNDLDGVGLVQAAARVTPNLALYVPRNTALEECARLGEARVEFEQHVIDDRVKTCCIYTGDLLAKRTLGLLE